MVPIGLESKQHPIVAVSALVVFWIALLVAIVPSLVGIAFIGNPIRFGQPHSQIDLLTTPTAKWHVL